MNPDKALLSTNNICALLAHWFVYLNSENPCFHQGHLEPIAMEMELKQNPAKAFHSPPPLVSLRLIFSSFSHVRKKINCVKGQMLRNLDLTFSSLCGDLSFSPSPPTPFPHCAGEGLGISRKLFFY